MYDDVVNWWQVGESGQYVTMTWHKQHILHLIVIIYHFLTL